MNEMTITFRKNKNRRNDYIVIFESLYFPDNIIMYFELDINSLKNIMDFINMLQKHYKISNVKIDIHNNEIEINHELESIFRTCPF